MVVERIEISPTLLAEIELLKPLSSEELETLITLGEKVSFDPHCNIIIEGEQSWGLYLLLSGTVGLFKTNKANGTSFDIALLHPGKFFGELSLIDENSRTSSVRSLSACELFYISKEAFSNFINQAPELKLRFAESCISLLVNRLREADENFVVSQYQLWKNALAKGNKS